LIPAEYENANQFDTKLTAQIRNAQYRHYALKVAVTKGLNPRFYDLKKKRRRNIEAKRCRIFSTAT
jgi:hypothetical protein